MSSAHEYNIVWGSAAAGVSPSTGKKMIQRATPLMLFLTVGLALERLGGFRKQKIGDIDSKVMNEVRNYL